MKDILNDDIHVQFADVVDKNGVMHHRMTLREARILAANDNLDLVLVTRPAVGQNAVCKIMNYHKVQFEKQKNAKKPVKLIEKEIQFSVEIGDADLAVKANNTRKWLEKAHTANNPIRVTVRVKMIGRMNTHQDLAFATFDNFMRKLGECAKVDKKPFVFGKDVLAILS